MAGSLGRALRMFELKWLYELHSYQKSKTYNRYTKTREKGTQTTLKKIIKPQGKRLKEEEKNRGELQKHRENK